MKCQICVLLRKKKKKFFLDYQLFFSGTKKNFKEQLLFSFLCIIMQKKISEGSDKKIFENFLNIFRTNFQKKIFWITPKFFFALQYIKNWTKVVPWKNFFCSWKKTWKNFLLVGPTVEDFNSLWFWLLRGSPFTLW